MKVTKPNIIKITLKNNDADNFSSVIKKINSPKIGFNQVGLSDDEKETLKKIEEKL